jgi:HAD superfamily hydrolase (TIGR01484 family)
LPFIAIGSGGSFTTATFAATYHQFIDMFSKSITPLEYSLNGHIKEDHSVFIASARGRNHDITHVFVESAKREPRELLALCMSTNTPLKNLSGKFEFSDVVEYELPTQKDGFLAVNSLMASMMLLARSYIENFDIKETLPRDYDELVYRNDIFEELVSTNSSLVNKFRNCNTLILIYDPFTKVAAIDAESKFSESGIMNIQLTDLRNFAHGRHNWLDKNKNSGIIVLSSSYHYDKLVERTLKLIPTNIPHLKLKSRYSGPLASFELVIIIMYLINIFGKFRNIDPGKPRVPEFGRKLYNLKSNLFPNAKLDNTQSAAIARKMIARSEISSPNEREYWISCYTKFVYNLSKRKFKAILFDYDGTLCSSKTRFNGITTRIANSLKELVEHDILVGIATGRGKSVRQDLQSKLPKNLWKSIVIGYYNCADISLLNDNSQPDITQDSREELSNVSKILSDYEMFNSIANFEERPSQITVEPKYTNSLRSSRNLLNDIIRSHNLKVNVMESTHSIDILPEDVSKTNLVKFVIDRYHIHDEEILRIGDRAKWPGNDYFFLSTENSLSVDIASADPNTCWNLLPVGVRSVQGLSYYLESIVFKKGYFYLEIR